MARADGRRREIVGILATLAVVLIAFALIVRHEDDEVGRRL